MNCYCSKCLLNQWLNNELALTTNAIKDLMQLSVLMNVSHKEMN